jgi:tetratricopeptide (TPR) repeat protein
MCVPAWEKSSQGFHSQFTIHNSQLKMSINPYITGKPVGDSSAFIGRADILRDVGQMLRHPKNHAFVLYGQRCIGKTSVLQHLKVHLPTWGNYHPVYFSLQDKATWTVNQVVSELARTIVYSLNQTMVDLGEEPKTVFIDSWLPNIFSSLPANTILVLLFDEFDVLDDPKAEQAGAAFFPYLRQLLNNNLQNLKFVFAIGRNLDDIDNIAVSLFMGVLPLKRLSLLNKEDTTKLVHFSENNNSLNWPAKVVECVWDYTRGHPFITQQICFHVWEQAQLVGSKTVPTATTVDVENVIFDVLDTGRNTLEWLWNGLPPAERVVASVLAETGPISMSDSALEKRLYDGGIHVVIKELHDAPRSLQDWDLLEIAKDGYRFRVELVRRWITENKPLRRVQDELDHIDPVAENMFRSAQRLYKEGNKEASVSQLREAILLNPNHLNAHQLLADILLAQGHAEEARDLLERLYKYKPLVARSRLIQALLELAKHSDNEEQQLNLYEQVLVLEPNQPEATAKHRDIKQRHGSAALARDDLKTALEIYQQLGINKKIAEIEQKIREGYFEYRTELDAFKKRKRWQISALTFLMIISGGWIYWSQVKPISLEPLRQESVWQAPIEPISQQSPPPEMFWKKTIFEQQLKQGKVEKSLVEQKFLQALEKKARFEQELKQANQKNARMAKELAQANRKVRKQNQEMVKLSKKTVLGKFMSQLETGNQIVVVGSYRKRADADIKLAKLKTRYPELFYPKMDSVSDNLENNIYKEGDIWEIFINGFYSYDSAKALKTMVLKLELIDDAFIRKNPFL